jgi:hypothetical protein
MKAKGKRVVLVTVSRPVGSGRRGQDEKGDKEGRAAMLMLTWYVGVVGIVEWWDERSFGEEHVSSPFGSLGKATRIGEGRASRDCWLMLKLDFTSSTGCRVRFLDNFSAGRSHVNVAQPFNRLLTTQPSSCLLDFFRPLLGLFLSLVLTAHIVSHLGLLW